MLNHHQVTEPDYGQPEVRPFTKILDWNFTANPQYGYRVYNQAITSTSTIPKYIFRGFTKAGHLEYKFDSKAEKDLAFVLEQDGQVLKWLRPAPDQFRIYWNRNTQRYRPDFVIETADAIYLAKVKEVAKITSQDAEVMNKKRAALNYCRYATDYTQQHGGKPWHYLLIPHTAVAFNSSFTELVNLYQQRQGA